MSATEKAIAPSIVDLINRTCSLPTLPDVLLKLNEVMADPEASADEVAQVISLDPSIATNILRIVNSAYYGLQVRVSSVNLAVSIMGFNMTRKVALKAAVFTQFSNRDACTVPHFDLSQFWRHSIYTGVAARTLGQATDALAGTHPEDLYICGLLHDIGKVILLESAREPFGDAIAASVRDQRSLQAVEQEVFGYTHADVGSVLAIQWFLPEELTIAIRYHHEPESDPFYKTLSTLVGVADASASARGHGAIEGELVPSVSEAALATIGLGQDDVDNLLDEADAEFAANGTPW